MRRNDKQGFLARVNTFRLSRQRGTTKKKKKNRREDISEKMPPKKNAVAARIKKLMQADDDVGKIAQATPVLMGTSLCFFPCAFVRFPFREGIEVPLC